MRKQSQGISILLAFADAAAAAAAWFCAYWIRARFGDSLPFIRGSPDFDLYLAVSPIVLAAVLIANRAAGLYGPKTRKGPGSEISGIIAGMLLALVLLMAATFLQRGYEFSRWILALFGVFGIAWATLVRAVFWRVASSLRSRGYSVTRALIAGSGRLGGRTLESIRKNPWLGVEVAGFLDDRPDRAGRVIQGIPVLGSLHDAPRIVLENRVNVVFIALPSDQHETCERLVEKLSEVTVDVMMVPDLASSFTLTAEASELGGLAVLSLRESPLYGFNRFVKRLIDVAVSAAALAAISPLLMLIAIGVKISSRGPVFFTQERVGLDGRVFRMIKFRSMRQDAEKETGAVWAVEGDPRRTRFGTFLRSTSMDELPQFLNVLMGHMSVVGPRPERPVFIEQFRKSVPKYMLRHKMKAGITGWAQVNGWRGDTSLRKRIQYDLYYIENWSLWFDLRIMLLTAFRGFTSKNAY